MISTRYPKLGNTIPGASWALKALHPAAKISAELRGIPDADSFPCVVMEYEQVMNVGPVNAVGDAWSCDLYSIPHPVQPLCFSQRQGALTRHGGLVNGTLVAGAVTYGDYHARFATLCHSYRMLYHSVTVDLDASGLNNNGSIVASQFPIARQVMNITGSPGGAGPVYTFCHLANANWAQNFPGSTISQLPSTFTGLAQDGCYMPLKLDPHSPWVNTFEQDINTSATQAGAVSVTPAELRFHEVPVAPVTGQAFPYWSGPSQDPANIPIVSAWTDSEGIAEWAIGGDTTVPLQQVNMGLMHFYNLNPQARLTCTVRWGVEMRVPPLSTLAPALQPSCMVDELALVAYSDLAASLPWAYPSSYNAEDGLIGMLKSAWNTMKPMLGMGLTMVPHPAAKMAGAALSSLPNFERGSGSSTVRSGPRGASRPRTRKPISSGKGEKRNGGGSKQNRD